MNKILTNALSKLLLVYSMIFTSCGTLNLNINHDTSFSRSTPITIKHDNIEDGTGTMGDLVFILRSNGYKLISYSNAEKKLILDSQRENSSIHSELTRKTMYKTVYVLEIYYRDYHDLFFGPRYKSFSARVTDMRTGELIMSASFRGDRSIRFVLEKLVENMNRVLK